jgi:predicted nucleic acid-binding Zn ribbon protein
VIGMTPEEMAVIFAKGAATPGSMEPPERKYGRRAMVARPWSDTCDVCGQPVPAGRRTKCSEACLLKANRSRALDTFRRIYVPKPLKLELRACDICTVLFAPAAVDAVLCGSRICSSARRRKLKVLAQNGEVAK